MTEKAYELSSTPNDTIGSVQEPAERRLELVKDTRQELLAFTQETYEQFSQAFGWSEALTDELFARVAGAEDEMSETLRDQLLNLYIAARSSSFVQADGRENYKFILDKFARGGQSVESVRESLSELDLVREEIDETYVTRHLLTTLSMMSRHQE